MSAKRTATLKQMAAKMVDSGYTARLAVDTADAAIAATGQVAREWRAFVGLTFGQRLMWLLTGRGPHRLPVAPVQTPEASDALAGH